MSVDFVARALAQRAGQAPGFTTLATGIPAVVIPSGIELFESSGFDTDGAGSGKYVSDTLATAALATAHPRFCKADAGGRYWRLLPDSNGLIPVACGGASGFSGQLNPEIHQGVAAFSAIPWSKHIPLSDGGAGPPGTTGNAALGSTAAGGNWQMLYLPLSRNVEVSVRIKAGTSSRIFILCEAPTTLKGVWIDPVAGTISQDDFGNATIASLGSGWYRVRFVANINGDLRVGMASTTGTISSAPGDTMHVFDVQLSNVAAVAAASATNDRPAIQAAIEYGEAIGAAGTRYDAQSYSLWRTVRSADDMFLLDNADGLLLWTRKSHKFVSTCGQTTLYRRDTDGSAMGIAKWTPVTDGQWRGGGITTFGQLSAPADVAENSIFLHDIMLDGGITDSSEQASIYGAFFNFADGDGWDATDKGIWQQNDRFCGHIVLEGRSGIRYFMGELIYGSGVGASIADREIRLGDDVDLGHTCGSCLNGNGQTLKVGRCFLHNGFIGVEGWTGHLGGYFKPRIADTNRDSLQGGIPNFSGTGSYFLKSRPDPATVPMGDIDLVLERAAQFDIGSWLSGRILAVDCMPSLGNGTAFNGGSQEVDLDIVTVLDRAGLVGGVAILGGASGTMALDRVSVRLACKRTDNAIANGYQFQQAVYCGGSYGPNVTVVLTAAEGLLHAPAAPSGTVYDYPIKVIDWGYGAGFGPVYYYDIEANNNATIDIKQYGHVIATQCSSNGSYTMNLPLTGVPIGYHLYIRDTTKNFVAGGASCRIPAANFRGGNGLIIPPGFGYAELEFDGSFWTVATAPPALSATASWDPGSAAPGASVTTTVSLIGAAVGDVVQAGLSTDLQGMMLSAHVSAAGTVTAVLFNPTGSAIDLDSGTLRVTVT